ncbi:helix-turn-helix domain-containing protein [Thalassobacillus sp. CUG 92003]|uniref:helix-turn-helix domain-containing protein n=1 Tax=Thalassobacillus sp. CUG 92003 TaxID=2736641 RepID=UPI0015E6CF02|nr:helix-turn-helix transcriptional regulator [Thalassobacillus sp. CUG 92003]
MEEKRWGKRIKGFRKLKGMTQIQLAHKMGVSVSVLGELERGSRLPDGPVLDKIAHQLNVTLEELMSKKENDV